MRTWMAALACAVSISAGLGAIGEGEPPTAPAPDLASLSGEWRGSATVLQRGKCPASRTTPGRAWNEIRGDLTFRPDGRLSATFTTGPEFKPVTGDGTNYTWEGEVAANGTMRVSKPSRSSCLNAAGVLYSGAYAVQYEGTLKTTRDGFAIEVTGIDAPCPEFNCTFKRVIKLTRKAP